MKKIKTPENLSGGSNTLQATSSSQVYMGTESTFARSRSTFCYVSIGVTILGALTGNVVAAVGGALIAYRTC